MSTTMRADHSPSLHRSLLIVLRRAQRLGLVAPFVLREWDEWWQQATYQSGRPGLIHLSRQLDSAAGRAEVAANYGMPLARCTASNLLAHELGHVFEFHWQDDQTIAPLAAYERLFDGVVRFRDPWNELLDYRAANPGATYDPDGYLGWYAWADPQEDFAEVFAEVVRLDGDCARYRSRRRLYRKMRAIITAGRRILKANKVLARCNRTGERYVFGGPRRLRCPACKIACGMPDRAGFYVCGCGAGIELKGGRIRRV